MKKLYLILGILVFTSTVEAIRIPMPHFVSNALSSVVALWQGAANENSAQAVQAAQPRRLHKPQIQLHSKPQKTRKNAWRAARGEPAEESAIGLKNYGAFCYQNATLQAIHKNPSLKTALIKKIESNQGYFLADPLIAGLHDVLTQLDGHGQGSHNPEFFAHQACHQFFDAEYGQQDAQEFLARLWASLETKELLPNSTPAQGVDVDAACAQWSGMNIRKQLKCLSCKQTRHTPIERSFSLPLDFLRSRSSRIQTLLEKFTAPAKLEGTEAVFCENCQVQRNHIEQLQFEIAPEMRHLVLHLKRFQGWPAVKMNAPILFDPSGVIKITDSTGVVHTFMVTSVVVHAGNIRNGHYICIARQGIFNDTRVTLDGGTALRELLFSGTYEKGQGYLYFLERLDD
jgi:ubiquitin C-terminal hydrolase